MELNKKIGIAQPNTINDPTGAGDSYRAGLIHGLFNGSDMVTAGKYGASMASFCLETMGGQGYLPTMEQIMERMGKVPDL